MVTTRQLRSVAALSTFIVLGALSSPLTHAATIGYTLLDHDFGLDSANKLEATFATNGSGVDTLSVSLPPTVNTGSASPFSDVTSYIYSGTLPDVGGVMPNPDNSQLFTVFGKKGTTKYTMGGALGLNMSFSASDGPFTSPGGGQVVSLIGSGPSAGHLVIQGLVSIDGSKPASTLTEETLLDITFSEVSLVATVGQTNAHVTAYGHINTLFGQDPSTLAGFDSTDVGIVDFSVEAATAFFTNLYYSPTDAVDNTVTGKVSGETFIGTVPPVPEPATLAFLSLGALGLLARRRRA